MKKLALVVSGWHFPYHFFKKISDQKIPEGWQVEMFCISHRDPKHSVEEKKDHFSFLGYGRRELYDRILYEKIASVEDIEKLGWKYKEEPNTIGDWGNINQWLDTHDYKEYDKFLFSHDDNFILNDNLFLDLINQTHWHILTNSTGNTQRRLRRLFGLPKPLNIRGSFEFFTKEMMDILGGKFDLSMTELTREGEVNTSGSFTELSDWNSTVTPLKNLLESKGLEKKVVALSEFYRVSTYCIEGERGYVHKTEPTNSAEEEKGLDIVEAHYKK